MYTKINTLIYKFENLGIANSSDGAIMIGKAPFEGPEAWLNIIYPRLSIEEVTLLENELGTDLPVDYKNFLMNYYSNGMDILLGNLSLYGLSRQLNRNAKVDSRQPVSLKLPNVYERPDNAEESYCIIGSYNWDGSLLYIDKKTNFVHCCERYDTTSKVHWSSFDVMLLNELKRLYNHFDEEGKEIDEDQSTLPYKE